ncbi:STAS domain-containing protein [Halalkalibacter oceani]|uniref:STAS domain-containing protein n=1 Tax=Halalkalibacter oceani TaxID=1653776 RepID=A0A9X2IR11_9BACI|nr:STAS domain-containing protein [Halalkalibacter oceani]MCM3716436.1 STAS domain-containing protein [Halalkalibacter oceani]
MDLELKQIKEAKEALGKKMIEGSEQLARQMVEAFYENIDSGERAADKELIEILGRLVKIIGEGLFDECVEQESAVWGERVGFMTIDKGGELIPTLKMSSHYKKVLLSYILEAGEQAKWNNKILIEIISKADSIVTTTVAGFAQAFISHSNRLLEESQNEYLKISVPIVPLSKKVAILPLIGEIHQKRAEILIQQALKASSEQGYDSLIIDVSGVQTATPIVIDMFHKLIGSLTLLGITPILTGIRPQLSKSFVQSNITLDGITIMNNLHHAVSYLSLD